MLIHVPVRIVSGKWVVRNWDGTISGVENGHLRLFDDIGKESTVDSTPRVDIVSTVDETCSEINSLDVEEAIPFAKIENVIKNSPSDLARLQVNDLLVKFGTVDHTNHREFVALSDIVSSAHANDLEIPLVILRKYDDGVDKKLLLTLKPEVWDGKGLVGCSFSRI
jgi:S1-C subfamily serine protease